MQEVILHGLSSIQLDERITIRRDGLDEVSQEFISTDVNFLSGYTNCPGYPNTEITSIEVRREAGDYRFSVVGVGIIASKGTKVELGYPQITFNLESLDEATYAVTTNNSNYIEIGDSLPSYSNMYCINVTREPIYNNFYRIQGRYVGIATGSKPYKRTYSVNNQVVTLDQVVVLLSGGWTSPQKGEISLAKITVTDTYITTGSIPTDDIGTQGSGPPDPPAIFDPVFSGDGRRTWPNGWHAVGLTAETIAGTNVTVYSITYEYTPEYIPA